MSTLATNKLGTLSGSADLSLPTTRPSATSPGFIDSSGNLTFGASDPSNVSTLVTADDGKVGKVLVDQVCSEGESTAKEYSGVLNSSGNPFYGYAVGVHNANEADKTNYLFDGNIRTIEIDFGYYVNGTSYNNSDGQMFYLPLNTAGDRLYTVNQRSVTGGGLYGRTYENPDSGGSRYSQGSTSYAAYGGNNNNFGNDSTYDGNYSGTGRFGKVLLHCGVNGTFQAQQYSTTWRYNRTSGDMFPTSQSSYTAPAAYNYSNTERSQGAGSGSPYGYGSPWSTVGGCFFSGGSYNGAPQMNYFYATAYAYIKPTTLATS